jgi:translation initiation factor IF-3
MQLKEVTLRPKIDDHDYNFKVRHAREFLEHRDKVKVTLTYRGRELAHIDLGRKVLDRVIADLAEVANVEQPPMMEGRAMIMVLVPKPNLQAPKPREHAEGEAEREPRERAAKVSAPAEGA